MPSKQHGRGDRVRSLPSCAELDRLLHRRNSQPARRAAIDREIFRRFQSTRAVFVLDMAGFSVSVQRHGIIHHLAKIHRMRELVGEAVHRCRGAVVKFEADNAFATFPTVRSAVLAVRRIHAELKRTNARAPVEDAIHVSIGIGHGPILLACDDFYGDEVNLASKLGEDIAGNGEVLLTEKATTALKGARAALEPVDIAISGVHLKASRLRPGSA